MNERAAVEAFHRLTGQPVRERPAMPSEAERLLRCRLLLEETLEYIKASGCWVSFPQGGPWLPENLRIVVVKEPDLAAMAHENADVRYIAHGNDLVLGAPPEVFEEVHRANMEKRWADGTVHRRADGKVVKPPGFMPADVARVLADAPPED